MISGEKKALVLAHPFFVKASKYPNEAPQRPETCTEQLYKPSRMKKKDKNRHSEFGTYTWYEATVLCQYEHSSKHSAKISRLALGVGEKKKVHVEEHGFFLRKLDPWLHQTALFFYLILRTLLHN